MNNLCLYTNFWYGFYLGQDGSTGQVNLCCYFKVLCVVSTLQSSLVYTNTVFAMIGVFIVMLSYSVAAITAVFVEQPIS